MMPLDLKSLKILMVEDNEGDIFLVKNAFEKRGLIDNLTVATDGEIALNMLYGENEFSSYAEPDLILLDINLPKIDGKEILRRLSSNSALNNIPVIVMTGSVIEQEILQQNGVKADAFTLKPASPEKVEAFLSNSFTPGKPARSEYNGQ